MERPVSIVWFERCYLGAVAIGVINFALQWNVMMAKISESMADNPAAAQLGPSFASNMAIGSTALSVVISALLWFFTARKGSVVTKWIVTVFFALSLLGFLWNASRGMMPQGIGAVLTVVAVVLNGIAVWQLFKPDTKVWFGEARA
jgi:small-conductance mechanosensitive channel